MRYHTAEKLSEHLELTPEGFLLCRDVPVARTGVQEYLPEEVPEELVEGFTGDLVAVRREPEDVFSAATMASFEGKPVTLDHPEDFVTPGNWRELAVGHVQNVRRDPEQKDLLLADLLITDQEVIDLILPAGGEDGGARQEPLREVSCGYDAEYEVVEPGVGRQKNIIGNHVALVAQGRCGSRCKINDKEKFMGKLTSQKKRPGWIDRLLGNPKVKKALDEAAAEEAAKDEEAPAQAKKEEAQAATDSDEKLDEILVLLRTMLEKLGAKAADEEPEGAGDEEEEKAEDDEPEGAADEDPAEAKTGDRAARKRVADRGVLSRAAALAPGLRFQAGDSACMVKRAALRQAMGDTALARVIDSCLGSGGIGRADCVSLDAAFIAASEVARGRNTDRTSAALAGARGADKNPSGPVTPAQINEINRKYRDSLNGK